MRSERFRRPLARQDAELPRRHSVPSMHFSSPVNAHSQRAVFEQANHGPVPVRGAEPDELESRQFDDPRHFQQVPLRQQQAPRRQQQPAQLQEFDERVQRPPLGTRHGGQPPRRQPTFDVDHPHGALGRPQPGSGQLASSRPVQAASAVEDDAVEDEFEPEDAWTPPRHRNNRPQEQTFRQTVRHR